MWSFSFFEFLEDHVYQCAKNARKCPFSHTVTLGLQNVFFLYVNLSKVLNRTIWDFLQVIFDSKVIKFQRYSCVTLHVKPKTPISEGSKKTASTKIKISPQTILLSDLVGQLLNLFVFGSLAWQIRSNWSSQKKWA